MNLSVAPPGTFEACKIRQAEAIQLEYLRLFEDVTEYEPPTKWLDGCSPAHPHSMTPNEFSSG
ncbi:hypothetical protein EYZ11_001947 [Aspergillus tanneri]|nr:hypothetical protein EYZ11_001947 [Aspergillus tanneri]